MIVESKALVFQEL